MRSNGSTDTHAKKKKIEGKLANKTRGPCKSVVEAYRRYDWSKRQLSKTISDKVKHVMHKSNIWRSDVRNYR